MALKPVQVSVFLDESGLQTEVNETQFQLITLDGQIATLEAQIADLKRQKEAIEANIKDIESLQEIVGRLKLRETEGIK